jgi:hypothetical protein
MRSIDNAPFGGEDLRRGVAAFARAVFAFVVRVGFFARALRSVATVLSVDWGS